MMSHGKICFTSQNFVTNSPNFKFSTSNEVDVLNNKDKSTFSKQMTFNFPPENFHLDNHDYDKKSICHTHSDKNKREINLEILDANDQYEGSSRIKLETQNFSQSCRNMYNGRSILANGISRVDLDNKFFITRPIQKDTWLKFELERKPFEKKGFKVVMSDENGALLLTVIKRPKKSYRLFLAKDEINEAFLGKLKSNFFGTEYNAYDLSKKIVKKNTSLNRANLATITFVISF